MSLFLGRGEGSTNAALPNLNIDGRQLADYAAQPSSAAA
jgi:hypothetical protein